MSGLALSRPLQLALLAATTLTAVALLKPDPLAAPPADPAQLAPAQQRRPEAASGTSRSDAPPWIRVVGEAWAPPVSEQAQAAAAAMAAQPEPPPPPIAEPPPQPVVPDPGLTYLGRINQDGRSHVFLGKGTDPQVVEIGGLVDSHWRVEKATATQIELRHLPLNEIRFVAVQ